MWDINSPFVAKDIYLQSSQTKGAEREKVADHILKSLKQLSIDASYDRRNITGVAADGQYTHLSLGQHISYKLERHVNLAWDPMHRIELIYNDSQKMFIYSTTNIFTAAAKMFQMGQNFTTFVEVSNELSDTFLVPKPFKNMNYIAHTQSVFPSFITIFHSYIAACEKVEKFSLRDGLLSIRFILNTLFLHDIVCCC